MRGIMQLRRVLVLWLSAIVLIASSSVLAQRPSQPQPPKLSKAEQADAEALSGAVDFAAIGQVPNDVPITWDMHHFMKSPDGGTVFPFVVTIDRSALPAGNAAVYIRLMDKAQMDMVAAAAKATEKERKDAKNQPAPRYAWQNLYFIDVPADGRLSRAIVMPPGEYEMFIAVKEKAKDEKSKTPAKLGVLRKTIVVPDFSTDLAVSDIILAKSIEQVQQLPSAKDQFENPYLMGPLKITPTLDPKFAKGGELNFIYWVYNYGMAASGKPDLQVEYNFHQKTPEGEKLFTRTPPQAHNASTLPAEWDAAKGHQIVEAQSIPLATFPAGEFRLEIKVTDKTNNKVLTKNIPFTVVAA
jgi:hypothetical protein